MRRCEVLRSDYCELSYNGEVTAILTSPRSQLKFRWATWCRSWPASPGLNRPDGSGRCRDSDPTQSRRETWHSDTNVNNLSTTTWDKHLFLYNKLYFTVKLLLTSVNEILTLEWMQLIHFLRPRRWTLDGRPHLHDRYWNMDETTQVLHLILSDMLLLSHVDRC